MELNGSQVCGNCGLAPILERLRWVHALLLLTGEDRPRFEIALSLHLSDPASNFFEAMHGGGDFLFGQLCFRFLIAKEVQELQFGPLELRLLDQDRFE